MNRITQLLVTGAILLLLLAGCVAPAPADTGSTDTSSEAAATEEPASEETSDGEAVADGALSGLCPETVVIQTDWFPEAEHGALYNLIGDDYTVDTDRKAVSGSLISGGESTGVAVEVRTGGPAIGFQQPLQQMYVETDITMGYVSTDEAVFGAESTPTIAVMAPLEKNPQIIMWDPETYPDVETIADLGEAGVTINVFAGGTFIDVFVSEGIISQDQVDPSYDGSPARWVAENGVIAQQGFASAEPYTYENEIAEWGKPVAFQLVHDAGLELYSQALAIRAADLETLRPCLEVLIPVIQQSVVDYAAAPERANAIIVDAVAQFNDFWVYNDGLAEFSVAKQLELGLMGNGPDATIGNMDLDRVQGVIEKMAAAGLGVAEGLEASTIATNEFIDESIGLP